MSVETTESDLSNSTQKTRRFLRNLNLNDRTSSQEHLGENRFMIVLKGHKDQLPRSIRSLMREHGLVVSEGPTKRLTGYPGTPETSFVVDKQKGK